MHFHVANNRDWKLPLFILEVHSSSYKNSVSKTAVDVMDQLRLLGCFNAEIPECVRFTFPKYEAKTFVTKVTVSFDSENLIFVVHLVPLKIGDVQAEVTKAIKSALSLCFNDDPAFCFIRLSRADLCTVHKILPSGVTQHPTKHSIMPKSDAAFF